MERRSFLSEDADLKLINNWLISNYTVDYIVVLSRWKFILSSFKLKIRCEMKSLTQLPTYRLITLWKIFQLYRQTPKMN